MDHHCHLLRRGPAGLDPSEFRACFTEARDPRILADHVQNTPLYRLLLRRLAPVFGCQPNEAAILSAVARDGTRVLARSDDAGLMRALLAEDPLGAPLELARGAHGIALVSV